MIASLTLALTLGVAGPVDEAIHALAKGRVEQAGQLIAVAKGQGDRSDRLQRLDAEHALASGATARALEAYRGLIARHPRDAVLLERGGEAALRLGRLDEATQWLERATLVPDAGWRAWNLRGVAADRRGDFDGADTAYARAATLAPGEASVANNRGWSLMLRGRWAEAEAAFETALRLDPKVANGAANLDLARAAIVDRLPVRRPGESADLLAARLNDAGVVAAASGDRARAVAAFSQAIEARSSWFGRAARNLDTVTLRPQ